MVLGAILLHNDAFDIAAHYISAASFHREAHRKIFASAKRLLERPGGLVDLTTLKDDLGLHKELTAVGGPAYITKLADGIPRSTNVHHYAAIVREKAILRGLIAAGNKMVTAGYEAQEPSGVLLASADRALMDLQRARATDRMRSLAATNQALLDDLQYRIDHKGQLSGVETGFPSINEMTMGWQAGDLIVVAARPSIGKTAWVMNSVLAGAESCRRDGTKRQIAVFSLEMRSRQLEYRILASVAQVRLSSLLAGYVLSDAEWARLVAATQRMHAAGIHIDDTAGQTTWDIRAECRRLKAEHGLDVVVIDYVQLMPGTLERRGANRNDEVTDISRKLKTLADELSVAIILLSQLNRAGEGRSDPRPKLTDLRESGALEQDADIVAFLHRKHHREGGVTNFILEKQRNGPTGTVNLTLDRDTTTFTDGGEEVPPSAEDQEAARHEQQRRLIAKRSRNSR